LMDFALKLVRRLCDGIKKVSVSILVLMDFALKLLKSNGHRSVWQSFNPCFDGFCSKTVLFPLFFFLPTIPSHLLDPFLLFFAQFFTSFLPIFFAFYIDFHSAIYYETKT